MRDPRTPEQREAYERALANKEREKKHEQFWLAVEQPAPSRTVAGIVRRLMRTRQQRNER